MAPKINPIINAAMIISLRNVLGSLKSGSSSFITLSYQKSKDFARAISLLDLQLK